MIRIGELALQTSISTQRLRAWEIRYGLLQPERTAGGLRLYGDADVARVMAMQQLIDSGLAPAEAGATLACALSSHTRTARRPLAARNN
ncbi:MAG: MerR family transcriptional regulator [Chloroflexi bacterium]|nr:MerR family transcriptional regulator [Chloroflexota bacterium]